MSSIAHLRKDFQKMSLLESDVASHPIDQFQAWWNQAQEAQIDEVNAMTLATASAQGIPSARIVYLKGFDTQGFVFFTNYQSHKGQQLLANPRACLVFYWKELERQVRIQGAVQKIEDVQSDEYFQSRPEGSRIGAWSSPQSQVIESRQWLEENERKFKGRFEGKFIERPAHWGGYRVVPQTVEFWQGRPNRLHDRIQYRFLETGHWVLERLAP